jgi:hypothetical protein
MSSWSGMSGPGVEHVWDFRLRVFQCLRSDMSDKGGDMSGLVGQKKTCKL